MYTLENAIATASSPAAPTSMRRRPFDVHAALQNTAASPKTIGASVRVPDG